MSNNNQPKKAFSAPQGFITSGGTMPTYQPEQAVVPQEVPFEAPNLLPDRDKAKMLYDTVSILEGESNMPYDFNEFYKRLSRQDKAETLYKNMTRRLGTERLGATFDDFAHKLGVSDIDKDLYADPKRAMIRNIDVQRSGVEASQAFDAFDQLRNYMRDSGLSLTDSADNIQWAEETPDSVKELYGMYNQFRQSTPYWDELWDRYDKTPNSSYSLRRKEQAAKLYDYLTTNIERLEKSADERAKRNIAAGTKGRNVTLGASIIPVIDWTPALQRSEISQLRRRLNLPKRGEEGDAGSWIKQFAEGFGAGFSWSDLITFGWGDLIPTIEENRVLEKLERGDALTDSEQEIFDLINLKQDVEGYIQSMGGLTTATSVGSGVGQMAPYMAGFGLGKAGAQAVTAPLLNKVTKMGAKQWVKNLTSAAIQAVPATGLTPTAYLDYQQRTKDQYFDDLGNLHYDEEGNLQKWQPTNNGKRLFQAAVTGFLENFSELGIGDLIEAPLSRLTKSVGTHLGLGKLYKMADNNNFMRTLRDAVNWNGSTGEFFEELFVNITQPLFTGEPDQLFETLSAQNLWETYLICAVTGGAMNVASASGSALRNGAINLGLKTQEKNMLKSISSEYIRTAVHDAMHGNSVADMSRALSDINWSEASQDDVMGVMSYMQARITRQMFNSTGEGETAVQQFSDRVGNIETFIHKYETKTNESGEVVGSTTDALEDNVVLCQYNGGTVAIKTGDYTSNDATTPITIVDNTGAGKTITLGQVSNIQEFSVADYMKRTFAEITQEEAPINNTREIKDDAEISEAAGIAPIETVEEAMAENASPISVAEQENRAKDSYQVGEEIVTSDGRKARIYGIDSWTKKYKVQFWDEEAQEYTHKNMGDVSYANVAGVPRVQSFDEVQRETDNLLQDTQQVAEAIEAIAPSEGQEPTPAAISRIPVDTDGNQLWEKAPVEDSWAALVEMNEGDQAQALDTAQQMLNGTMEALDKLDKASGKQLTVADIQRTKAEKKQLSEAQNYWSEVVATGQNAMQPSPESQTPVEVIPEAESTPVAEQTSAKEKTPQYRLSEEIDENGRQFVETSNGSIEFGTVEMESGLTPAPILLSEGMITNPQTNDGYGLVHIEARHGDQIRQAGYKSVVEFVEEVAKGYTTIREGKKRDGQQTYLLQLTDKHNNTLMVELSSDGTYWNINTAGIFKTSYGKNGKVVYNRYTTAKQTAESVEVSQESEQSGSTETPSINTPTSPSTDKDTTSIPENQIESQEVAETPSVDAQIEQAEQETNPTPTDAQKEAGNYKKGHIKIDGFDITIETPKGVERSGVDEQGNPWSITMNNTYGYIRGTEGVDGDHIDLFLSDNLDDWNGEVFVVDQVKPDGSFDEHKVMYGFNSIEEAQAAYLSNYSEGWQGLGTITGATKEEFQKWVASSHRKTKPFAEYKSVKTTEGQATAPEQISLNDYLGRLGVSSPISNYMDDKLRNPRGLTANQKAKLEKEAALAADEYQKKRAAAIEEYQQLVKQGKIIPASQIDTLLATANGHPDNESTQAARRALEKRGYDWQTGSKIETPAGEQPTEPISVSEQSDIEDEFAEAVAKQGYIERLPKKTKYSIYNFTGDKSLRPIRTSPHILEGVLYDNGFRIASDGRVLVKEKSSYPAEYEGTTRMRDGIRTDNGVKYPNYKVIIDDFKNTNYKKMDFEDFLGFLNAIEERVTTAHKQEEGKTRSLKDTLKYTPIAIKLPTGETWWGSLTELQKFALAAKQFGADKVYSKDATKMFLAKNSKGEVALVMPVMVYSYPFEGSTRYYYEPSLEPQSSEVKQSTTSNPILASKEPAPTASKENSTAKIEDFGEKIGGARKDLVREKVQDSMKLSNNDLANLKDPDKILSRANIIKYMREGQITPDDASTLLALNMATRGADSSFSKPIMMNKYRQCALDCLEGRDVVVEITNADIEAYMSAFAESIRSRSNFEHTAREVLETNLATFRNYITTYEAIDYPEVNRNIKTAYIEYHKYNDTYWVVKGPKAARGFRYSTLAQAVAKFKSEYPEIAEVSAKSNVITSSDDKIGHLYITKDERGYYRIKSRLIPGNIYLSGRLNSKKVAEQHLKDNAEKLVQREQKMAETLMGSNIGMVERKGKDYRKGKDVTPQDFLDTFGVRGVEFGNWVPQAERQLYLNKSYDAIMDLCAAVGISPRAFSLGGSLGLAFGSRGKSRALAHYEPLKEVINLTRLKGAGSLAHEWFHALDNYMAKQVGGDIIEMATHNYRTKRPEVSDAFRSLVHKMNELPYTKRSNKAGDYWGEVWERAARLFQSYIYNKLGESNTVSPLLVRGDALFVESDFTDPDLDASSYPYPSASENEIMKPYFDTLFDTIQEREENGKTILYQVEEGEIATTTANITTDEIIDLVRASGVEVETATPETIVTPAETFYSNAEFAVRGIKQEKATPEQWLKMIEKNGGLKAGEDKWLGLSDWLKESKAKTLTKEEVLEYINSNKIVVEDVEYGVQDYMSENEIYESDEYRALEESLLEYEDEPPYIDKEKFKELRNKDEDFVDGFDVDYWGEQLLVKNPFAAARYLGISNVGKRINETRLAYTTNGLDNKREIALVVPTIEPWNKSDEIHFGDAGEGRAVAWVRFGETEAPVQDANYKRLQEIYDRLAELEMKVGSSEGITMEEYEERARLREERDSIPESGNQRVLVIDEIQSKRHQEGRENGYYDEKYVNARLDVLIPRMNEAGIYVEYDPMARSVRFLDSKTMKPLGTLTNPATDEQKELMQQFRNLVFFNDKVKPAPFEKNWHEVAMKRILRYAAENGYDKVAWTTGAQQAERYDISKTVDNIKSEDNNIEELSDGTPIVKNITIYAGNSVYNLYVDKNGVAHGRQFGDQPLADIVGKPLAEKLMEKGDFELEGDGLRIGGEGMRAFYDQILPNFMNKYGKKWGVKVGEVTMPDLAENNTMHSVDITPAMRESVLRGQPLFLQEPTAENPKGAVYGWMTDGKIYLTERGLNPETPIHEYTHIWDMVCQQENPELWAEGVKLMKQLPLWEEVRTNPAYEKIADNENLLASEVHARLVAPGSANILDNMLEEKSVRPTFVSRLRTWLSKVWRWLRSNLMPGTKLTIEQFKNMPLRALVEGEVTSGQDSIRFRSNEMEDFTPEEQEIAAKAKADGTYLKAPNGQPTNLTPEQWVNVRTSRFKEWFGDWENDPENASKVVDANGEPMVVYHGSNWKGITTFDRSQSKRRRSGLREYGHFFTTNRALAEMYSNVDDAPEVEEELSRLDAQIEAAAENKDIAKMLDLYTAKERITRNLGGRVYEVFLNMRDVAEFDADYQADRGWYNLKADVGYKTAIGRDAMEAYAGQNSMTGDRLRKDGIIGRNIIDLFVGTENKEALKPYFDKFGGDVFLVFDPQNIKSATENVGTFDANNSDIRFRESDDTSYPASKQQMADAARDLASQLNTPVEVYTEIEEITDPNAYRQRRMRQDKGWWTSNGTIGINISRHDSIADVEATILHEMVGHKGLREVVGSDEEYNELLDRVWNHLTPEEQKSWLSRYADRYEAMDEYLATLAEGNVTLGVWDRIVGWFRELLNKVLGRKLQISDHDIAYLLWKSRARLQKPKSVAEALAMAKTDKKYRDEAYRSRSANAQPKKPEPTYIEKFSAPKIREILGYHTTRNGFTDKLIMEDSREAFLRKLFEFLPKDIQSLLEKRRPKAPIAELDRILRLPQKENSTATLRGLLGEKLYDAVLSEILPPFWNAKYVNGILRRWFQREQIRLGNMDRGNTYLDKGNPNATFEQHGKVGSSRFNRKLFDNAEPIKKFQERLEEAFGVVIDASNNLYSALNRWASIAQVKIDRFNLRYIKPLLSSINAIERNSSMKYDDVVKYVKCKHAMERHETGITTFPTGEDVELKYPEWNYHRANVIIANFEKAVPAELVAELWRNINLMNKATLNNAVASGNLSLETKERILSHNWKYYVPLCGWDMSTTNAIDAEKFYDFGDVQRPKGISSSVYFAKIDEGRTSEPANPIANMMNFGYRTIVSGENNKMKQVAYKLCADAEAAARKQGKHPEQVFDIMKRYAEKVNGTWKPKALGEEITDEFLEELEHSKRIRRAIAEQKRVLRNPDLSPTQKEIIFTNITRLEEEESVRELYRGQNGMEGELPVAYELDGMRCVNLYINGEKQTIKFADPLVAMAINGELTSAQGWFSRAWGRLTRLMSGLFTSYNPAFVVPNMIRDFRHSFRMHMLDSSYGGVKKFTRNLPLTYGAIWRKEKGKANPLSVNEVSDYDILHSVEDRAVLMEKYGRKRVLDTLYNIFEEQGGLTGYVFTHNIDEIESNLRKLSRRNALKSKYKPVKGAIDSWEAIRDGYDALLSVSEGSTRFATFIASLENGATSEQAAQNAKDITVNFNRRGEWSKVLGSLYLFFNASMQAANQEFKAAKKNPAGVALFATYRTASSILNSVIIAYALDLINGDDDDERNDVEIPIHVRLSNTVIPIFSTGKYIKIPLAQGSETLFNSLGVYLYELMEGNMTASEFAKEIVALPFDAFSPLAVPENGSIMRTIMPSVGIPFYDIWVNEDYLGRPIHRDRYSDATPAYQLGLKSTPEFFVKWATAMNTMLGGNEIERGSKNKKGEINGWKEWLELNPSDIHHVLQYYAGGSIFGGKFLWNTVNTIQYFSDIIKDGESEIDIFNEIPIMRRFIGEAYVPSKSGDYYHLLNRLKVQHADFLKYEKRWKETGEAIPDYIERDEKFYQYVNDIHKWVKRNQEYLNTESDPKKQKELQQELQDIMFEAIYLDENVDSDAPDWEKQFDKAIEDYNKKYLQR